MGGVSDTGGSPPIGSTSGLDALIVYGCSRCKYRCAARVTEFRYPHTANVRDMHCNAAVRK